MSAWTPPPLPWNEAFMPRVGSPHGDTHVRDLPFSHVAMPCLNTTFLLLLACFLFTATLGYSSTFSRPFSHSAWFYSFFLSFSALSLSIFLFLWGRPERVELTLDHRRWPPACFPRAKWTVEGHNGEAHRGTLGGKTSNQTQIKLIK